MLYMSRAPYKLSQHGKLLVDNEALTPGSMFGYVITRHTVKTRDQPPLVHSLCY